MQDIQQALADRELTRERLTALCQDWSEKLDGELQSQGVIKGRLDVRPLRDIHLYGALQDSERHVLNIQVYPGLGSETEVFIGVRMLDKGLLEEARRAGAIVGNEHEWAAVCGFAGYQVPVALSAPEETAARIKQDVIRFLAKG